MTARLRSAVLLVLLAVLAAGARADLYQYLARPEPAYKWEFRGEKQMDDVTVYDLHLVSQTWQGIDWEHKVQIFKPAKLDYPGFCGLYNTGGGGSSANEQMGALLARNSGCLYAIVYGIPKQPLYGGKTEDALVVYTWLKYLETKDESWPLHFPMAKAVLKAADAHYQAKVDLVGAEAFSGFERSVILQAIDQHWREHLSALDGMVGGRQQGSASKGHRPHGD